MSFIRNALTVAASMIRSVLKRVGEALVRIADTPDDSGPVVESDIERPRIQPEPPETFVTRAPAAAGFGHLEATVPPQAVAAELVVEPPPVAPPPVSVVEVGVFVDEFGTWDPMNPDPDGIFDRASSLGGTEPSLHEAPISDGHVDPADFSSIAATVPPQAVEADMRFRGQQRERCDLLDLPMVTVHNILKPAGGTKDERQETS